MSWLELLGLILAILLCILTGYAIGSLILGPKPSKKQEYDGVLIINDSPEKQSWDINMNTELDKLCKRKYIVLEVHYYESNKYKKELSPEMNQWIKEWNPKEEEE